MDIERPAIKIISPFHTKEGYEKFGNSIAEQMAINETACFMFTPEFFVPNAITCTRIADEGCTEETDLIIRNLMRAGF